MVIPVVGELFKMKKSTPEERAKTAQACSEAAQVIINTIEHLSPAEQDAALTMAKSLLDVDRTNIGARVMQDFHAQMSGIVGTNGEKFQTEGGPDWVKEALKDEK